jgi:hypothetical protein
MKTDEMSRQRSGVSRRSVSCGAHLPHIEQSVEWVMSLVHVKERCVEVGGQLGRTNDHRVHAELAQGRASASEWHQSYT